MVSDLDSDKTCGDFVDLEALGDVFSWPNSMGLFLSTFSASVQHDFQIIFDFTSFPGELAQAYRSPDPPELPTQALLLSSASQVAAKLKELAEAKPGSDEVRFLMFFLRFAK